ncbi:glycosyltransferase family 2 protein [Microbacterium aoyamense]|uniref:Glycosyltransferase family 2 protein n=1 Tax=Microbacterium aoyamense TaxID=344166 RepID=A0ABN2PNB5_9MICO|nr:glycosyltransferase [Microbacterium aoyamense]
MTEPSAGGDDQLRRTVTLLVPVFDEEEVVDRFHTEVSAVLAGLHSYVFEILFVDDGSRDSTPERLARLALADPRVSILRLSRNFGKESAMLAGLDVVASDAVILIDVDLQDPPALIVEMLAAWEEGYDDVYARRRTRAGESAVKRASSRWYYRLLQRTTRIEIQTDTGDFRLLDRRCIDVLVRLRESERYTKGLYSWIGFRKKEILFDRAPRAAGRTKWNYPRLMGLAVDGFTSFTTTPLRISTFLGLIVSLAAFIYLVVILLRTIFFGIDLAGYPSMMAVILFLGGVQLISLGIIGEYVARIFTESKRRPVYVVQEHHRGDPR